MLKTAIIGLGNRGRMYARKFSGRANVKMVAACEKNGAILSAEAKKLGIPADKCFCSDAEFFAAGKLADCLIIATQDKDHYAHAISALRLGYHLLLEKPVSPDYAQCKEIADLAEQNNCKVVVCHVLRYSDFYQHVKQILDSGAIGKIVNINHSENIGYWHFSHSYVRGNWRREDETSPSVLAKCCHDLDIIYYFTGQKCTSLWANGSRPLFHAANAPEGAAERCLAPCVHRKTCPYDVKKLYYGVTRHTIPLLILNWKKITEHPKPNVRMLKNVLATTSPYGRCVYKCDNDVMENHVVGMRLEGGAAATLTMTAFSKWCFRRLHIAGTKGEIIGCDKDGKFRLNIFGGKCRTVRVGRGLTDGHLGGDEGVVNEFIDYVLFDKKTPKLTLISETLESHRNAILSEKARKENIVVDMTEYH